MKQLFRMIVLFILVFTFGNTVFAKLPAEPKTFKESLYVREDNVFWKTNEEGTHIYAFSGNDFETWDIPGKCHELTSSQYDVLAFMEDGSCQVWNRMTGEKSVIPADKDFRKVLPDTADLYYARNGFRVYYDVADSAEIAGNPWQMSYRYYIVTLEGTVTDLGMLDSIFSVQDTQKSPCLWVGDQSGVRQLTSTGEELQTIAAEAATEYIYLMDVSAENSFAVWDEVNGTNHSLFIWNGSTKISVEQYADDDKAYFSRAYSCDRGKKVILYHSSGEQIFIYDVDTDSITPVTFPMNQRPTLMPVFAPAYVYSADMPWSDFYMFGEDPDYFRRSIIHIYPDGNAEMLVDKTDQWDWSLCDDSIYYTFNDCLYRAPRMNTADSEPELISSKAYLDGVLTPEGNALYYIEDYSYESETGTLNVYWADTHTSEEIDTGQKGFLFYPLINGESVLYQKNSTSLSLDDPSLKKSDLYLYSRGGSPQQIATDVLELLNVYTAPHAINPVYISDNGFYYTTLNEKRADGQIVRNICFYDGRNSSVIIKGVTK